MNAIEPQGSISLVGTSLGAGFALVAIEGIFITTEVTFGTADAETVLVTPT